MMVNIYLGVGCQYGLIYERLTSELTLNLYRTAVLITFTLAIFMLTLFLTIK